MKFLNFKKGGFPSVPSSLAHRDAIKFSRELPRERLGGESAPFLGLRSRLSQIWLNRWTVLLILVLVRVLILIGGLNVNIGVAKEKALSACTKVEDVGSAMASMPHYLSVGVNKVTVEGISAAVRGLVQVIGMILTGVENLIFFVINFYVGTWLCLISALIHGTLEIGIGAAEGATKLMNSAISKTTDALSTQVSDFSKGLEDALRNIKDAVGRIPGFGSAITIPEVKIDISSKINDLKNIQVDSAEFVKGLSTIKDNTPTFDDAVKFAKDAIAIPFDKVREELNKSSASWTISRDIFPVAKKEALSFCSDNSAIRDFFEGLYTTANTAKIAFLVVIPILAVLICVPMAMIEIRRYREQRALAERMHADNYDAMDVIYQASRPKSSRVGLWLSRKFKGTNREYLVRWAWAYSTSMPALFVLSLAIAGLFSCFCSWLILIVIRKEAPALVNKVGDFAAEVVRTLQGVSTRWATDTNGAIGKFNNDVNSGVLGHVRVATSAVNNTLNVFEDEMNKRLDQVFKDTVLHKFAQDIVRCVIGIKLEAVEKGLNWVHEQAQVTLPRFPNDTFSLGASESINGDSKLTSFLASPSTVTTDEITDAVYHVINFLENGIITDALISAGLLLVYVIIVLVGVIRALLNITGPQSSTRGMGGGSFHGHHHGRNRDRNGHEMTAAAAAVATSPSRRGVAMGEERDQENYAGSSSGRNSDGVSWNEKPSYEKSPPPQHYPRAYGQGDVNNPYGEKV